MAKKNVFFRQNNAPIHTSVIAMAKINELKFKLLFHLVFHTSYSPDLAPSDFLLFSNLKKFLDGQRFSNNEEVESVVNDYFEELDASHYKQGIETIEHHWGKCIKLRGKNKSRDCQYLWYFSGYGRIFRLKMFFEFAYLSINKLCKIIFIKYKQNKTTRKKIW